MALFHLLTLARVGRIDTEKLAFDPSDPARRKLAVDEWRKLLKDGKLPPAMQQGQPPAPGTR